MFTPTRRTARKHPVAVVEDATRIVHRLVWLSAVAVVALALINIYNLSMLARISHSIG